MFSLRWKTVTAAIFGIWVLFFPASCPAQEQDLKAWWKFDEGTGNVAVDSVTGRGDKLMSPRWRPGVSGTALAMDGVTTHVFRT